MKRVLVPIAKGFEEIEAISIIDVLRRANIDVVVAGVGESKTVEGANGIKIECDTLANTLSAEDLNMVVLPGGWGGTDILSKDEHIQKILKDMASSDKRVGAICAAPFALNQAGVLADEFTCYPSVEEQINKNGYRSDKMVVKSGNVMTSRGPGTALCFGLSIVRELAGEEQYQALKSGLLADYCQE